MSDNRTPLEIAEQKHGVHPSILATQEAEIASYTDLSESEVDAVKHIVDAYMGSHRGTLPSIPGIVNLIRSRRNSGSTLKHLA